MELEELLDAIRKHPSAITFAGEVLKDLDKCVGGHCPVPSVSDSAWKGVIRSGEHKLVHNDPSSRIWAVSKQLAKSDALPAGTIGTFDCTITTTKKDRAGDVLEASGAIVDPKMPLLWQHCSFEPIGSLVKVLQHNSKRVKGRFAIIGTALGNDAMILLEAGALRISHGFRPLDWEKLEPPKVKEEGDDGYYGWRFTKFEIMETSLVSVPCNDEAVIDAFARNKFASPLVKSWAGAKFRERPLIVPGADLKQTKEDKPCGCQKNDEGKTQPVESAQPEEDNVSPAEPKSTAQVIAEILTGKSPLEDLRKLKYEMKSNLRQIEEAIVALEEAQAIAESKQLLDLLNS